MPPFIGQATIQAPANETPKQLALLGETLGNALEQRRNKMAVQEVGKAFQSGDLPAAQKAAFRLGRPDLALRITSTIQQQKQFAASQALAQQRLGIAQSQLGLAQNADARAQVAADQSAAMHGAKMNFIQGLSGGAPQPAPNPYYDVPARGGGFGSAPQAGIGPNIQSELAAGALGMPQVAQTLRAERTYARDQDKKSGFDDYKSRISAEAGLRKEFTTISKDFIKVRDAHRRVEASAKDPSAAGDLALIFNYMKVLDPGSTVREGEFATAQNSGGIPARVQAMYNSVIRGERLDISIRNDFVSRSKSLFESQKQQHDATRKQFRAIAERIGLTPDNVVVDFGSAGLSESPSGTPPPPPGFVEQ